MSALTCGLDVHKDWSDVTVRRDSDGEIVGGRRRLPNGDLLGFLSEYHGIERIAMEASTSIIPVHRALRGEGYNVVVSHPKKTRLIAESMIKTDRVDSEALSELARLNALPLSYIPEPGVARLREKVRRRAFLVRMRSKLRVKVRSFLLYEGIKEPEECGLFTAKGVTWLHSLELDAVESYLPILSAIQEQVEKISKGLKRLAPNDEDAKLLMTIPGVGYYSALLIKSEVGSIDRFSDGEHLCSYAGLVPSVSQTGEYRRYGRITKEGSPWLRWAMTECAGIHVKRYDTSMTRAYNAMAQSKGKGVAKVAVARRLLMCCYSVLKNRRPYYDPSGNYKDGDQARSWKAPAS